MAGLFHQRDHADRQRVGSAVVARAHGDADRRPVVAVAGHPRDFPGLSQDGQGPRAPVRAGPAGLSDCAGLACPGHFRAGLGAGRRVVHRDDERTSEPRQADHRPDHAGCDALRDLHRLPDLFHADLPGLCLWHLGRELQADHAPDDAQHQLHHAERPADGGAAVHPDGDRDGTGRADGTAVCVDPAYHGAGARLALYRGADRFHHLRRRDGHRRRIGDAAGYHGGRDDESGGL